MQGNGSTIVFFPEGAFGPTNNCVGIGAVLRRRGHRVVFIVEESFAGTLEAQGFEERLMPLTPPPEIEEAPGQFWKDFIRDTAPVFRKSTTEQLREFIGPPTASCTPPSASSARSAGAAARGALAQPADERAHDRPGLGAAPGAARARGTARLSQPRARSAPPTSS
jgi:hypothetical protein